MKKTIVVLIIFLFFNTIFSQTNNLCFKKGGFSIDVLGGNNTPLSDIKSFVGKGSGAGITFRKNISNNFSLDISGIYNSFSVKDKLNSIIDNWTSSSIILGPQYKFNFLMFEMGFYGKIGYSFQSIPKSEIYYPDSKVLTDKFANNSSNTLDSHFGANLSFKIIDGIRIVGNFDYSKNLGNTIEYQTRDITSAINEKGRILYDVAEEIPFENKSIGLSSMAFSVGISIDVCGGCSNNTLKSQNWNSTQNYNTSGVRSFKNNKNTNQYNNGENLRNGNNGNGEENNNIPPSINAQDWNSSRSNKTSKTSRVGNPNGDGNNESNPANNYNTSRSNKRHPIVGDNQNNGQYNNGENVRNGNNGNGEENNNIPPSINAQDWNSSRSNKTSKTSRVGNPNGDGNNDPNPANNHNTSRSNKRHPIVEDNQNNGQYNNGENVRNGNNGNEEENNNIPPSINAQDWNSSRSNKTSKTQRVANPNGNGNNNQYNNGENLRNGNNGNTGTNIPPSTNAQDWNSSRSNKTSKTQRVANPNGNGNNNNPSNAQDWNSSRSNKTSKTQ